jgi:hypothetical protein
MDNASDSSHSSPEAASTLLARRSSRADRPCDTCRKRKSRCVKEPGQQKCVLCTFHHRDCTYVDEPQRRKRKRPEAGTDGGDTEKEERYFYSPPRKLIRSPSTSAGMCAFCW